MLGEADGPNGYVNTYWSAHDFLVQQSQRQVPGLSRKEYNKMARERLGKSIQSYKPMYYSQNTAQGKVKIKDFMSKVNPEYTYLIRKTMEEYNSKKSNFWINVNTANKDGRFTNY